jgi:hypothetical protein
MRSLVSRSVQAISLIERENSDAFHRLLSGVFAFSLCYSKPQPTEAATFTDLSNRDFGHLGGSLRNGKVVDLSLWEAMNCIVTLQVGVSSEKHSKPFASKGVAGFKSSRIHH